MICSEKGQCKNENTPEKTLLRVQVPPKWRFGDCLEIRKDIDKTTVVFSRMSRKAIYKF